MISQSIDLIKLPTYPWHLFEINAPIDTCGNESMTPRYLGSSPVQLCLIYFYIDRSLGGWHMLFCTTNNHPLRCFKGTCNYTPLSYLDEYDEANGDTMVLRC